MKAPQSENKGAVQQQWELTLTKHIGSELRNLHQVKKGKVSSAVRQIKLFLSLVLKLLLGESRIWNQTKSTWQYFLVINLMMIHFQIYIFVNLCPLKNSPLHLWNVFKAFLFSTNPWCESGLELHRESGPAVVWTRQWIKKIYHYLLTVSRRLHSEATLSDSVCI